MRKRTQTEKKKRRKISRIPSCRRGCARETIDATNRSQLAILVADNDGPRRPETTQPADGTDKLEPTVGRHRRNQSN